MKYNGYISDNIFNVIKSKKRYAPPASCAFFADEGSKKPTATSYSLKKSSGHIDISAARLR